MPTFTDTGYDPATAEDFLAIVLSDDELVQAEFDAIVAAEWSDEPPEPADRNDGHKPSAPAARIPAGWNEPPSGRLTARIDRWRRQRSPPSGGSNRPCRNPFAES